QVIPSDVPGNLAMGLRQGAGIVLAMAPWNAPLILATRAIATPLACGNTVILKGSELSPATHSFDADLQQAAAGAIFGAFANAGQICMSTERIIVDESIADEFVALISQRAAALPSTLLGPVVDMKTVQRCNALIDDALNKGARLLCGGKAESTQMRATLLDGVTREMRIWHEESFGPVKSVIRVNGEEEALAVANDSEYGLAAAVYSRDTARAWNVSQNLQTGICHINGPTVHDEAQMPFGGCKSSGYGRFGGRA
ncbi:salicylaldehyde dehydrogenase, partial [Klebsiella aerogenes]